MQTELDSPRDINDLMMWGCYTDDDVRRLLEGAYNMAIDRDPYKSAPVEGAIWDETQLCWTIDGEPIDEVIITQEDVI